MIHFNIFEIKTEIYFCNDQMTRVYNCTEYGKDQMSQCQTVCTRTRIHVHCVLTSFFFHLSPCAPTTHKNRRSQPSHWVTSYKYSVVIHMNVNQKYRPHNYLEGLVISFLYRSIKIQCFLHTLQSCECSDLNVSPFSKSTS